MLLPSMCTECMACPTLLLSAGTPSPAPRLCASGHRIHDKPMWSSEKFVGGSGCFAAATALGCFVGALTQKRASVASADKVVVPGTPSQCSKPNLFEQLGRPRYVLAPMVDQSELPFRLLARRYGAQLCYTPMINANSFLSNKAFRKEILDEAHPDDRPLIVQLAGHDPETLLQAARQLEGMCDAIDLNLGCPQHIARRGRYGSFLLEEEDLVVQIVQHLSSNLNVPVTCKIRLFRDDLPRTIRLCHRLEDAGCAMLTVHGRTRHQNKQFIGECDFSAIAAVKAAVKIPVIANGGIAVFEDIGRCMELTGADGVMSSEAALENPALFCGNVDEKGQHIDQSRLANEYLDLAQHYYLGGESCGDVPSYVKSHMFKLWHTGLRENHDLRDRVARGRAMEEFRAVALELETRGWTQPKFGTPEYCPEVSWYFRHRLESTPAPGGQKPAEALGAERKPKASRELVESTHGDQVLVDSQA